MPRAFLPAVASLALLSIAACGSDDGSSASKSGKGADGGIGASLVPPGELPSAASFVAIKGTDVAVADGFACAITTERKIVCWGAVQYQSLLPLNALGKTGVEIAVPSPPKSLSFNGEVGCAVLDDGSVRCWGSSARGTTGAGTIGTPSKPGDSVSVAGFPGPVDYLQMGDSNSGDTCAIAAGHVYCWDPIRDGVAREIDGGITDAKLVAKTHGTTCVVRADAKVYCWGANDFGQLGIPIGGTTGTPPPITTPTLVPDLADVTALEMDDDEVCALSKGNVLCWGDRWYAPMTAQERQAPIPKLTVAGLVNATLLRKDPDDAKYCAISGGNAFCFETENLSKPPVALKLDEPGAVEVALHRNTRCGVFADNAVKCWGFAGAELGDGAFLYHPIPTFVPDVAGATKLFADPGGACIVDKDGHASCWGDVTTGADASIGDGHVQRWPALDGASFLATAGTYALSRCGVFGGAVKCASKPTDPVAVPVAGLANVVDFAMADPNGCARLADGTLTCWQNKAQPAVVAGLAGVKEVVLVSNIGFPVRICVLQDGVKCWDGIPGANDGAKFETPYDKLAAASDLHGQGGSVWCGLTPAGATCDVNGAVTDLRGDIGGTSGASLLTVGARHGCAVVGGSVQCWGDGTSGQLGSGNFNQSKVAFPVSNAGTSTALSAGADFTCSLESDGRVRCWGSNGTGSVSAPPIARALPTQVRVIY